MWFPSILTLGHSGQAGSSSLRCRSARSTQKLSRRLILEALEDRMLLSYAFTRIADTASVYRDFSLFRPGLNQDGTVVFGADLKSGGEAILTRDDAGSLNIIAITSDLISAFDGSGPSLAPFDSATTVAFRAKLRAGGRAIFTGDGGELTRIADTNHVFQDFLGIGVTINSAGTVAFLAKLASGEQCVGVGTGGPPTILYKTGSQFSAFPGLAAQINQSGTVAFIANLTAGGQGVFTGDGGTPTTIADTTDGTYSAFTGVVGLNDNGVAATRADLTGGGQAIIEGDGQSLQTLYTTGPTFKSFGIGVILNNSGLVAFQAELTAGGGGIFTGPDPVADKVIGVGDPLFGSTVTSLDFRGRPLNDAGQMVFRATLADGLQVIARADPDGEDGDRPGGLLHETPSTPLFVQRMPEASPVSVKTIWVGRPPDSESPGGPEFVWWSMPDNYLPQGRQFLQGLAGGDVPAGLQFMPVPAASLASVEPVLPARPTADQSLDSGALSPALVDVLAVNLLI